jgi:GNAT superfamily N-acetyltransferase
MTLRTHCFVAVSAGPDGPAGPPEASEGGQVRAIARWFVSQSTWVGRHGIWLEDLDVEESARGLGVGRALLRQLAQECLGRGYARLDDAPA